MGNIPKVEILNFKLTPITYHFLLYSIFSLENKGFATLDSVYGIIESQNSQFIKDTINQINQSRNYKYCYRKIFD